MPLPEGYTLKRELAKPAVPEGVYQCEIVDLHLEEGVVSQYGKRDRISAAVGIVDGKERAKVLLYFMSPSFSKGGGRYSSSKAYELTCAVEGKKLDDKEPYELEKIVGKQFNAVVKHKETERGTFANIVEVMKVEEEKAGLTDDERNTILEELEARMTENVKPDEVKV